MVWEKPKASGSCAWLTLEASGEGGLDLAACIAGLLLDDAQGLRVGDARVSAVARDLAVVAETLVHLHHPINTRIAEA